MTGVPSAADIGRSQMYFAINYDFQGNIPNETDYGGAFYTPYSTGTGGQTDFTWDKRPSITIQWSVPDPVDMDYTVIIF